MIQRVRNMQAAASLFEGWEETMIWSCLQGIMGDIYGDDPERPDSAAAFLGDFIFFAGRPSDELVLYRPEGCSREFVIMVPENESWAGRIEAGWGESARRVSRYAVRKEPQVFDREKLQRIVGGLPEKYELRMVDEKLYDACRSCEWSRDLVAQYDTYEKYRELGLGAVVLENGKPVSGASSYTRYREGIEIEIDTEKDHRRQGLASVCGAKLILECLNRGLYPSWDAQNLWSVALAEKLGYHYSHAYTAYEIRGYFTKNK